MDIELNEDRVHDIIHSVTFAVLTFGLKYLWKGLRYGYRFYQANKDTEVVIHFTYRKAFWGSILFGMWMMPWLIAALVIYKTLL